MSKGEEKVIELLQKGRYRFEREKRFRDLKHGLYRFDFYVVGGRAIPCILEYNGEQHYQYVKKFYATRAEFEAAKERDRRKISYCLAHNIPLYIIPYWELENLHTAADLFNPRFRAASRWKNDQDWQRQQNLTKRR
jgi:hypothetical protein